MSEVSSEILDQPLEIKTTTCYMCACRCGIRVHLRRGEVRYIDGNPHHPQARHPQNLYYQAIS